MPVRPSGGQWEAAGHPVRGHAPVTCRKLMRPHSRGDGCRGGLGRTGPCQEVWKWLALFRAHHVRGGGGTASGTGLADLLRDTVSSEELYHEAMSCACVGRTQQPGGGGGWFRQAHTVHGARVGISKSILKQSSQTLYRSCNYEGFHSTPEFNYNRFIPNVLH